MPSVKRNIVANYFGSAWSAFMGVALIPLYIRYLGMESYGLIGVFGLLQTWLVLLDLGLSQTLSRELARYEGGSHTPQSIRNLVRSVELIYLVVAGAFAVCIISGASWLATRWLHVQNLPTPTVITALKITGVVVAFRFVAGLYRGGIVGLQHQVWLNGSNIVFATLRGPGVLAALIWISPTIFTFFAFQGIVSGIETGVLRFKLHRLLPRCPDTPKFSLDSIRQIGRFAAGITAITLLSLLLMQADKLLLSTLLPLKQFGYYTLAGTVAGALYLVVSPISTATYPRLAELVARGETITLSRTYHRFCQLVAITSIPASVIISIFSKHILLLWTRNPETSASAAPLVSLLAIGTMANTLMYIPYGLQLAYGWTRFASVQNAIAVVLLLPAIYVGVSAHGAVAGALIWGILNTGYVVVCIPLMHRRLLRDQMWTWYRHDVLVPLFAALFPAVVIRLLTPSPDVASPLNNSVVVICASSLALGSAVLFTPLGREHLLRYYTFTRLYFSSRLSQHKR